MKIKVSYNPNGTIRKVVGSIRKRRSVNPAIREERKQQFIREGV